VVAEREEGVWEKTQVRRGAAHTAGHGMLATHCPHACLHRSLRPALLLQSLQCAPSSHPPQDHAHRVQRGAQGAQHSLADGV
jgi:hypothetical protein